MGSKLAQIVERVQYCLVCRPDSQRGPTTLQVTLLRRNMKLTSSLNNVIYVVIRDKS